MTAGIEGKWPVLGRHERAAEWLGIWADLGRAPQTIDAYARGLAEYLEACERDGADPLTATRAQVAGFVRELRTRPPVPRLQQAHPGGQLGRQVQHPLLGQRPDAGPADAGHVGGITSGTSWTPL